VSRTFLRCVVPEFVSNGPFRVRIYVYPLSHTEHREQRENHKATLQSNLEFNSIVRGVARTEGGNASPKRPRDLHTHTLEYVRFRVGCVWYVRRAASAARGPPAGQLPTADTVALST
jgi:hypothetical protein